MDIHHIIPGRFARAAAVLVLAVSLALYGCSGGGDGGSAGSGGSGDSGKTPRTNQQAQSTTENTNTGPAETTAEPTTGAASAGRTTAQGSGGSTALSGGLGKARKAAKSWNGDAKLYAIVSVPPDVNAAGENGGWLYSFVSSSAGSAISIPYSGGEIRNTQGQTLPEQQIKNIEKDTISPDKLVDSPEAIQRSDKVKSYLEKNPGAGISVSVDSASTDQPQWILQVPSKGLQEEVSATK